MKPPIGTKVRIYHANYTLYGTVSGYTRYDYEVRVKLEYLFRGDSELTVALSNVGPYDLSTALELAKAVNEDRAKLHRDEAEFKSYVMDGVLYKCGRTLFGWITYSAEYLP